MGFRLASTFQMKSFLIISFLLSEACFSQDTTMPGERIKLPIDYDKLAKFDFEKALKESEPSLKTTVQKTGSQVLTMQLLCGGWQGEAMGNSWGGIQQKLVQPNKRIIFKEDSIFFYRNDSLVRATTYRLVTPSADSARRDPILLEPGNSGERWRIILYQIGESVPWHGRARKLFLLLNRELNCLCGCPEELYSEEISFQAYSY
jgi:hypothetical protein